MIIELNPVEARVLGSLVEKSLTTREQYPLTFNALLNACNQKTSRDPVMELDTDAMGRAVQTLIDKNLAERVQAPGDRVPKFRHYISNLINSDDAKLTGIITVLLLRGPQTPGEIKGRTDRLCEFTGTAEVEGLLQELCARAEGAFVARQPRQPGQKEVRYYHLFSGAAPAAQPAAAAPADGQPDRLALLEKRVEALEAILKIRAEQPAAPAEIKPAQPEQ
ncbi:MAG TPA: YceH family protein [Elusimicrobiales bacterium]|nr:YceH family protein [Elusimicrobiales bacterium]